MNMRIPCARFRHPDDLSLGTQMSVQWYFRRIRAVLHQIWQNRSKVHPLNRRLLSEFPHWGDRSMWASIEDVLSGLNDIDQVEQSPGWDKDTNLRVFKTYVQSTETQMAKALRDQFKYSIDDLEALRIVTGASGRLEKVGYSLTCLHRSNDLKHLPVLVAALLLALETLCMGCHPSSRICAE
jgi:hypothetical protein